MDFILPFAQPVALANDCNVLRSNEDKSEGIEIDDIRIIEREKVRRWEGEKCDYIYQKIERWEVKQFCQEIS